MIALMLTLACTIVSTDSSVHPGIDKEGHGTLTATSTNGIDTAASAADALVLDAPARDVVLISVDTLRRDAVGSYQSTVDITPTIDGFLDGGLRLDDHRSCSNWTLPSMTCVLTGRSSVDMDQLPLVGMSQGELHIPDDAPTLSSQLGAAAFTRVIVSANAYICGEGGLSSGDHLVCDRMIAEEIVDEVIVGLDAWHLKGRRLFLHAHFNDPHANYTAPEAYLSEVPDSSLTSFDLTSQEGMDEAEASWRDLSEDMQDAVLTELIARYHAEVRYLDDQIARLMEELGARGLLEDALVVFVSDHGEQLFDHGRLRHARDLYGEETLAMAAFWHPTITPGTWEGPTTHTDITPTILHAAGLAAPEETTGIVVGHGGFNRPTYAMVNPGSGPLMAVTYAGRRLHFRWNGWRAYFDIDDDPRERKDLYDSQDPHVLELWDLLYPYMSQVSEIHGVPPADAEP